MKFIYIVLFVSGGWYILGEWSDSAFDKNELLETLHTKYGISPYFQIAVEPNPNMPGKHAIRISPSGLGLPDREYYYREEDDRVSSSDFFVIAYYKT